MLCDNQALAVMLFRNNLSLTFFNHLLYDFFSEVVDWGYQDKQGATKVITWLALKGCGEGSSSRKNLAAHMPI
jgi:hypothetical protein